MKNAGLLCALLLVLSTLAWAQTSADPWTTDPAAEIADVSGQITAYQQAGQEVPADLMNRLTELERQEFSRHHDISTLDQGAEDCASATVIPASNPMTYCDMGIMGQTEDCNLNGTSPTLATYRDIFYSFTPIVSGDYIITTCGSIGNTALNVWQDACCSGTRMTCDNDSCTVGLDARRRVALSAGTTYYLEIGYTLTTQAADAYYFNVTGPIPTTPTVPSNDLCSGAAALTPPATVVGTTWGAGNDTMATCVDATVCLYGGVWYTVVGDGHRITASTDNDCSTFNTIIKVYSGDCGSPVCVGGNDNVSANPGNSLSSYTWCGEVGVTYYVGVGVSGTAAQAANQAYRGPFTLAVTVDTTVCSCSALTLCGTPVETEPNNTCATFDAIQLNCGSVVYARHCPESDSDFYKFTVPAGYAMTVTVYDGEGCTTYPPTQVTMKLYRSTCAAVGANFNTAKTISRCGLTTDSMMYICVLDAGAATPVNRIQYKIEATCLAPVTNDLCADAIPVGIPSATAGQTACGATTDAAPTCVGLTPASPGVWYKLVGNGHVLTADACQSDFNNRINVYGGDCDNLVCVGSNNDGCTSGPNTQGASVTWCSVIGETYFILVYGNSSAIYGNFTLTIADGDPCGPADNDLCANAQLVSIPSATAGTISWCSIDTVPSCYAVPAAPGVWYKLMGNGHLVSVDACISDFNNTISVFQGPDCDHLTCVGGDADSCDSPNTLGAKFTWCTHTGVTYWVLVFGASSTVTTGTFTFTVSDLGPCDQNDFCDGAILVDVPSVTDGTTQWYSSDYPAAPTCYYNPTGKGGWYKVIGNGHQLSADLCINYDPAFNSIIMVYGGDCDSLYCINWGWGCPTGIPIVTWCSEPGVEYHVLVTGFLTSWGAFTLTIYDGECCVFTDYCANPILVSHEATYLNTASSCCATNPVPTIAGNPSGPDVIYRFSTLTASAVNSFTASGSGDNQIILFTGCADPVGTAIAQADNGGPGVSEVLSNVPLPPGIYYVGTSLRGTDCGSITLHIVSDVILPVNLQTAEAIPGDGSVTLRWTTASENDNDHFEIVRDGRMIGRIAGAGTSPARHDYSWTEEGLNNGTTYTYTLRSVGVTGRAADLATLSATPNFAAGEVTEYALHQNYPNPFNPVTTIAFDLLEAGNVSLKVYNLVGQEVRTVASGMMPKGRHTVSFDAAALPSGIYLYRIEVNGFVAEKKMLLMK
jgi:hypothetical protein